MSRAKSPITGREVYILSKVIPYDGTEIIGVFDSADAAMHDRAEQWYEETDDGQRYWTSAPLNGGWHPEDFYIIESFTVRGR